MKKKKIVIAVVAVILVLVVAGGSVAAYVIKKASPYKKIVDAYNNTINADNFDISISKGFAVEDFNLEVYGKGKSGTDIIVTAFDGKGYSLSNAYCAMTGDKMYTADTNKEYSLEDSWEECLINLAQRDVSKIYSSDAFFHFKDFTGLSYEEMYDAFFNTMINYVTENKDSSAIQSVNVSKDEFSVKVKPLELFEKMGDNSDFDYKKFANRLYSFDEYESTKDLSWNEVKQQFNDEGIYWEITIKLNDNYLDSIRIDQKVDEKAYDEYLSMSDIGSTEQYEDDDVNMCWISVQFDNVNQLTDDTSIGKQIMKNVK
ncbi:MAG: hypothetical protein PUE83_12740 [Lachnobacterium sp.]|nr:hypothetical protein [Lachnobacterium sp.]